MTGTDFVGTVTIAAGGGTQYSILTTYPVSVSAFPGTWLATQAKLWERYRFNRLSFRFVPATATSVACQLVGWIDTDPYDDPAAFGSTEALVRQALSQYGSSAFNIITPARFDLAQRKDREEYYTGPDKNNLRFTRAGNFYLAQVTRATGFDGKLLTDAFECGSIYVDWDVSFETPQIDPPSTADPTEKIEILSCSTGPVAFPVVNKGDIVSIDFSDLPFTNLRTGEAQELVPGTKYRARLNLNSTKFDQALSDHYDQIVNIRSSGAAGYQQEVSYANGTGPLGEGLYATANQSAGYDGIWNVVVNSPDGTGTKIAQIHAVETITTRTDGDVNDVISDGSIKNDFTIECHAPDAFGDPSSNPGPGPPLSNRPVVDGFLTDFIFEIGSELLIEFLPNRWVKVATLTIDLALELLSLA